MRTHSGSRDWSAETLNASAPSERVLRAERVLSWDEASSSGASALLRRCAWIVILPPVLFAPRAIVVIVVEVISDLSSRACSPPLSSGVLLSTMEIPWLLLTPLSLAQPVRARISRRATISS
eukprot:3791133-Prymnesium_polylepis.4